MLLSVLAAAIILCSALPWMYYVKSNKSKKAGKRAIAANILSFATVFVTALAVMVSNSGVLAAGETASAGSSLGYIGAALATGLACIGAGYAVAQAASAALGAISENENLTGKALIFVALAEGIALYGMVISIIILNKF